jgi:hypothetical protein
MFSRYKRETPHRMMETVLAATYVPRGRRDALEWAPSETKKRMEYWINMTAFITKKELDI